MRDEHMTHELETINGERWANNGQAELVLERGEFEGDDRELLANRDTSNGMELGKVSIQTWAAVEEAKKPENAAWDAEPDQETVAEAEEEGKKRFNPGRWVGEAGKKILKKIRPPKSA
ncbi:MAG: hypothetical protein Q9165_006263 [Trypethelium subeluteriae]